MDPTERLEAADRWIGEGRELAHRVMEFADVLRQEMLNSGVKADIAGDLDSIVKGEWNPCEQPR